MMRGNRLIISGLLLVAAALIIAGFNLFSSALAGRNAQDTAAAFDSEITDRQDAPAYMLNPDRQMPVFTIDGVEYIGTVDIPSIGVYLPVAASFSYDRLKISLCRYEGSVYKDNMIICGHNYRTHLGRLSAVSPGDDVVFTDADGNVFRYVVSDMESVRGEAIDQMKEGEWDLTLFTCTPGGRSRLAVRCERK